MLCALGLICVLARLDRSKPVERWVRCFELFSGNEKRQRFVADVAVKRLGGKVKAITAERIC